MVKPATEITRILVLFDTSKKKIRLNLFYGQLWIQLKTQHHTGSIIGLIQVHPSEVTQFSLDLSIPSVYSEI